LTKATGREHAQNDPSAREEGSDYAIGQKIAGQEKSYEINIYGSKKLTPILLILVIFFGECNNVGI
jgi:hypothetical protein